MKAKEKLDKEVEAKAARRAAAQELKAKQEKAEEVAEKVAKKEAKALNEQHKQELGTKRREAATKAKEKLEKEVQTKAVQRAAAQELKTKQKKAAEVADKAAEKEAKALVEQRKQELADKKVEELGDKAKTKEIYAKHQNTFLFGGSEKAKTMSEAEAREALELEVKALRKETQELDAKRETKVHVKEKAAKKQIPKTIVKVSQVVSFVSLNPEHWSLVKDEYERGYALAIGACAAPCNMLPQGVTIVSKPVDSSGNSIELSEAQDSASVMFTLKVSSRSPLKSALSHGCTGKCTGAAVASGIETVAEASGVDVGLVSVSALTTAKAEVATKAEDDAVTAWDEERAKLGDSSAAEVGCCKQCWTRGWDAAHRGDNIVKEEDHTDPQGAPTGCCTPCWHRGYLKGIGLYLITE